MSDRIRKYNNWLPIIAEIWFLFLSPLFVIFKNKSESRRFRPKRQYLHNWDLRGFLYVVIGNDSVTVLAHSQCPFKRGAVANSVIWKITGEYKNGIVVSNHVFSSLRCWIPFTWYEPLQYYTFSIISCENLRPCCHSDISFRLSLLFSWFRLIRVSCSASVSFTTAVRCYGYAPRFPCHVSVATSL